MDVGVEGVLAAVELTSVGSPSFTTLLLFKEATDVFRGHDLVEEIMSGVRNSHTFSLFIYDSK